MKYYAGIGARNTPPEIKYIMTKCAAYLQTIDYVLRSGGANGADSAFERDITNPDHKEIYLPWGNFNGNQSTLCQPSAEAFRMAAIYHLAWHKCNTIARGFHARNCHQVLGLDLKTPSDFILCWTPKGEVTGGTGQALRIAIDHNIPIANMFNNDWRSIVRNIIQP